MKTSNASNSEAGAGAPSPTRPVATPGAGDEAGDEIRLLRFVVMTVPLSSIGCPSRPHEHEVGIDGPFSTWPGGRGEEDDQGGVERPPVAPTRGQTAPDRKDRS